VPVVDEEAASDGGTADGATGSDSPATATQGDSVADTPVS
jgi:hypothetical protein